jgi:hypothetical protein
LYVAILLLLFFFYLPTFLYYSCLTCENVLNFEDSKYEFIDRFIPFFEIIVLINCYIIVYITFLSSLTLDFDFDFDFDLDFDLDFNLDFDFDFDLVRFFFFCLFVSWFIAEMGI